MKTLILAGGEGERLRPVTEIIPKALINSGNRPLIELIIDSLIEADVNEMTILTSYFAEKIENFVNGRNFKAKINFARDPVGVSDSLEALYCFSKGCVSEDFLVINADSFFPNAHIMSKFLSAVDKKKASAFLGVGKEPDSHAACFVDMQAGLIRKVSRNCKVGKYFTAGGVFFFSKRCVEEIGLAVECGVKKTFEFVGFLIDRRYKVGGILLTGVRDINTPEDVRALNIP